MIKGDKWNYFCHYIDVIVCIQFAFQKLLNNK